METGNTLSAITDEEESVPTPGLNPQSTDAPNPSPAPDLDGEDQAEVGEGAVEAEEEEKIKFMFDYIYQLLGWGLIEVGYRDSASSNQIQHTTIWISLEYLCQILFCLHAIAYMQ